MTDKQPPRKFACTAEQATSQPPQIDGPTVSLLQQLKVAGSTPAPLAIDPHKLSRIEIGPELQKAVSYGQLWRLELEDQQAPPPNRALTPAARAASQARAASGAVATLKDSPSLPDAAPKVDPAPVIAKPRTWLGVFIACLLGAVPIMVLVLARWQGNQPEVPATPMGVIETGAGPTQVSDVSAASAEPKPAIAEAEPEFLDAPFKPRVAPAPAPQVARATITSPPISRPSPAPSTPAPLRSSWFHR